MDNINYEPIDKKILQWYLSVIENSLRLIEAMWNKEETVRLSNNRDRIILEI